MTLSSIEGLNIISTEKSSLRGIYLEDAIAKIYATAF